mmetsp:Transcript_99313/g.318646  ORF Transcript_99313/g.318646 Transcript_99313/m.318646 type:complete len:217 (+) Transcript_99313:348-998(+)
MSPSMPAPDEETRTLKCRLPLPRNESGWLRTSGANPRVALVKGQPSPSPWRLLRVPFDKGDLWVCPKMTPISQGAKGTQAKDQGTPLCVTEPGGQSGKPSDKRATCGICPCRYQRPSKVPWTRFLRRPPGRRIGSRGSDPSPRGSGPAWSCCVRGPGGRPSCRRARSSWASPRSCMRQAVRQPPHNRSCHCSCPCTTARRCRPYAGGRRASAPTRR